MIKKKITYSVQALISNSKCNKWTWTNYSRVLSALISSSKFYLEPFHRPRPTPQKQKSYGSYMKNKLISYYHLQKHNVYAKHHSMMKTSLPSIWPRPEWINYLSIAVIPWGCIAFNSLYNNFVGYIACTEVSWVFKILEILSWMIGAFFWKICRSLENKSSLNGKNTPMIFCFIRKKMTFGNTRQYYSKYQLKKEKQQNILTTKG